MTCSYYYLYIYTSRARGYQGRYNYPAFHHNCNMDEPVEDLQESQLIAQETPADHVFMPPSIDKPRVMAGSSYSYVSPVPDLLKADMSTECVLGVDEAGRGPVLGKFSVNRPTHIASHIASHIACHIAPHIACHIASHPTSHPTSYPTSRIPSHPADPT